MGEDIAIVLNIARWIIVIYVYVGIQAQREGLAADAARRPCCESGAAAAEGLAASAARPVRRAYALQQRGEGIAIVLNIASWIIVIYVYVGIQGIAIVLNIASWIIVIYVYVGIQATRAASTWASRAGRPLCWPPYCCKGS